VKTVQVRESSWGLDRVTLSVWILTTSADMRDGFRKNVDKVGGLTAFSRVLGFVVTWSGLAAPAGYPLPMPLSSPSGFRTC
jgi:hypothetical protein